MAVHRPDVLQPEVLEHPLRGERVLEALLDGVQRVVERRRRRPRARRDRFLIESSSLLVPRVGPQAGEMLGQAAHGGAVGAAVVVDDDDQLAVRLVGRDVVERLPGHPAGERAVADDRHHVPVLSARRYAFARPSA